MGGARKFDVFDLAKQPGHFFPASGPAVMSGFVVGLKLNSAVCGELLNINSAKKLNINRWVRANSMTSCFE